MIKNHAWLRPAGGIENEEKQARDASGVDGFGRVSIREMACRTARFVP